MRLLLALCVVLASLSLGACYSSQPAPGGPPSAAPGGPSSAPSTPTPGMSCGGGGKA